jgi:hypothetical protein
MGSYASIDEVVPAEVTFNTFVVSLATTAAVHFGDVADPASGEMPQRNIEAAGQAIEMLTLLEEKTRGNLAESEKLFLTQVLFELRARYVEARKAPDEL